MEKDKIEKIEKEYSKEKQFRSSEVREEYIDADARTVKLALTSEAPVSRSFGLEILDHSSDSIDSSFMSSGRAPLLLNHDQREQIGVVEKFYLDSDQKRTIAEVRFGRSALAEETFQDVRDGIKGNVSVGYQIQDMKRDTSFDEPAYRVDWKALEASIVSVPADQSSNVGIGRSDECAKNLPENLGKKVNNNIQTIEVKDMSNEIKKPEVNVDEIRKQTSDEVKAEIAKSNDEILELGARHNKSDLARKAIREGQSLEQFRGVLLNAIGTDKPLETPEVGLTEKETKRFSLVRAINAMANPTDRRAQEAAKFEFECSEAAGRAYNQTAQGVLIAPEVLANWKQRDMNASDDSALVADDFRGDSFIDVLRNKSAVLPIATTLSQLSGDDKIPRKSAASTAAFISAEGGASGESEMTVGSVSLSPKTAGVHTDVTRQLLIQSSLDVENLIRDDLAGSIAVVLDDKAVEGNGSSGNPTGITNTSGINTVSLSSAAAPTWAEIVSMESAVAVDNALLGDLRYLVHPTNYGTLKTTAKASNTAVFIAENNEVNGYPVIVSPQLTANNYVFGNFSDLLIGFFGGLDVIVDSYTHSSSGTVRIVALQSMDVAVRHAVSFCAAS